MEKLSEMLLSLINQHIYLAEPRRNSSFTMPLQLLNQASDLCSKPKIVEMSLLPRSSLTIQWRKIGQGEAAQDSWLPVSLHVHAIGSRSGSDSPAA